MILAKDDLFTIVLIPVENKLGEYSVLSGMVMSDLEQYLLRQNISFDEFYEVAGMNTGFLIEDTGEYLMFWTDIERFTKVITEQKPTYFD